MRDQFKEGNKLLEGTDDDELIHEHEIEVPSISTAGARNLMQRLWEEAKLDIGSECLKPHGGRPGLGHELYSKGHAELAQTALCYSIETTYEAYSDIQAEEKTTRIDKIIDKCLRRTDYNFYIGEGYQARGYSWDQVVIKTSKWKIG